MARPQLECTEVEEILVGLLQGRGRRGDLEPHLEHIRDCRDCGAMLALAHRPATGGAVPDPGAGYWRDFLPRLESRLRADAGRRRARPGLLAAVLSIAAVLLVAIGWMVIRNPATPDDGKRLEARFEQMLLDAPEQRDPAATALEEILPDDLHLFDWTPPDSRDPFGEMDAEWILAAVEIEDVQDMVGPPGSDPVLDLDGEAGRELLRQLREELENLDDEIPEVRWDSGSPFAEEEST